MALPTSIGRIVGGKYLLEKEIGRGSFSVVWKGRNTEEEDRVVAIKEISLSERNDKLQQSLMAEIEILQRNIHPNIVRLHDVIQESGKIFIVLEYCEQGDLKHYIENRESVLSDDIRNFMIQLAAGLKFLRSNNLIHRDLKPQNLLLSMVEGKMVLKIADFGFGRELQPQDLAATICGSPLYMAPEVMQSHKYDAKADLWSVGSILYHLITGRTPFSANSEIELLNSIMTTNYIKFPPSVLKQIHPDCIDLCRKLLQKDPVQRISFEEFFTHKFINQQSLQGLAGISMQPVKTSQAKKDDQMASNFDRGVVHDTDCTTNVNVVINALQSSLDAMVEVAKKMSGIAVNENAEKGEADCMNGCNLHDNFEDEYVLVGMAEMDQAVNNSACPYISGNSSRTHLGWSVVDTFCPDDPQISSVRNLDKELLPDDPKKGSNLSIQTADCTTRLPSSKQNGLHGMCLRVWRKALSAGCSLNRKKASCRRRNH